MMYYPLEIVEVEIVAKIEDFSGLSQALVDKTITKKELLKQVKLEDSLIPLLLKGVCSSRAAVRYGCAKVLMDLSDEAPEKLYPHFDLFIELLDSKYRILIWNALTIIANLTRVDVNKKFDSIFNKYYSLLDDDYMVTVANVIGNSATIANAKPYLVPRIIDEMLKIQDISLTPHLTEECKRVIAQQAIKSFDLFFDRIENKEKVLSFVRVCLSTPRKKLGSLAEAFLEKWDL